MDFSYTEEQLALQETLQRFIAREYGFERRRELMGTQLGYSAEAWTLYGKLGFLALPFPEEFGGLGGNAVDVMMVMELVGQGLLLEPYLSTVVLSGGLILDGASQEMKQRLLPSIGNGRVKLAFAAYEAAGRYDLSRIECTATPIGNGNHHGWRLSGNKTAVLHGSSADHFLVSARNSCTLNVADRISLFLVSRDSPGLTLHGYPTQCGGRAADLRLENVHVGVDSLVGVAGQALPAIEHAVDRASAALCAEAVGIITALNAATVNYLKTRKQFGVQIGKFQVLQHRMAEMFIAGEQARSMAILAAVSADTENVAERRRAISAAKAYIGQAARLVGQQAVQMHGAMGVVDDLIVSHYFKRLTMIDVSFGDTDFHLAYFSDKLSSS